MEEQVRKLNDAHGFGLTEEEIKLIATRAEEANRLFQPLFEVDLTDVMPILKLDRHVARKNSAKKGARK